MRNQNIYTSKVSWGLEVGSTGNSKPLNIPRAFIIEVNNTTDEVKSFRMMIGDPGPGGQASFLQFGEGDPILELDVEIAPNSSISRPVFFQSTDPNASLRVDVIEIDAPGVPLLSIPHGGLLAFGVPAFGVPAFGVQAFGVQAFGVLAFGVQAFGVQAFGVVPFQRVQIWKVPRSLTLCGQ